MALWLWYTRLSKCCSLDISALESTTATHTSLTRRTFLCSLTTQRPDTTATGPSTCQHQDSSARTVPHPSSRSMPSKKFNSRSKALLAAARTKNMVVTMGKQQYKLVPIKKQQYTPFKPFLPRRFGKAESSYQRPVIVYRN